MIYLVSTSPRRIKILKELGIPFKVVAPRYEENMPAALSPSRTVMRHALGKARSVAWKIRTGTVLGCDTLVYFGGQILGKPKDMKDAYRILGKLVGRTHTVYTGVAALRMAGSKTVSKILFYEKTRVTLKKMALSEMRAYFGRIRPLDKAGAYAIQSEKSGIVQKVQGSFLNAVGLPVERLRREKIL